MFFILNKSSIFVANKQDMIIVIFGQPGAGKTTIAQHLVKENFHHIDGDVLRDIFKNKDYSREGRIKNLNRASDIAVYMNSISSNVVLSFVYPYEEAREYLSKLTKGVKWIYLIYQEDRGRDQFKVADFELPHMDNVDLIINTSNTSVEDSVDQIKHVCRIF
jgi:adenylylsulfate kinase-like enzyme